MKTRSGIVVGSPRVTRSASKAMEKAKVEKPMEKKSMDFFKFVFHERNNITHAEKEVIASAFFQFAFRKGVLRKVEDPEQKRMFPKGAVALLKVRNGAEYEGVVEELVDGPNNSKFGIMRVTSCSSSDPEVTKRVGKQVIVPTKLISFPI